MMTATDASSIPPLQRPETTTLAEHEHARMADLLASLSDDDWRKPTDCPAWDVRALAGHAYGMTETFSALPKFARDMIAGTRAAGDRPQVDGMTEVQVSRYAPLTTGELVARLRTSGPAQARWRSRRRVMRHIPLKVDRRDGTKEKWKLSFIVDIILTRDSWMHRVDIARATGKEMALTPAHDGRLVADVVAEWARRHGQPFSLELTGPAGGVFKNGEGGEHITIDAVEFCRILSGRAPASGLLTEEVPF
jgi:uncharacterized protein (TIGR03083 family)